MPAEYINKNYPPVSSGSTARRSRPSCRPLGTQACRTAFPSATRHQLTIGIRLATSLHEEANAWNVWQKSADHADCYWDCYDSDRGVRADDGRLLGGSADNEQLIGSQTWKTYSHAVSHQHVYIMHTAPL